MEPLNTHSLPLTLIERLLTIAVVHTAQTSFTGGPPNQMLVPYLNAFGPRSEFPAPSQAALMRCWWIDCDTAAVATDLDMLEFLGQMADRHPHRPLRFTETAMTLASRRGHLPVLDWWVARLGFAGCKYNYWTVLREAAAAGALHVLDWWQKAGMKVDYSEIMRAAAGAGHISVLEWCVARCRPTRSLRLHYALAEAGKRGQIQVLEWWHSTHLTLRTWPSLEGASRQGRIEVLEWWKALASQPRRHVGVQGQFMCTIRDLCGAIHHGNHERKGQEYTVVKWWINTGLVTRELLLTKGPTKGSSSFHPTIELAFLNSLWRGYDRLMIILEGHGLLPQSLPLTRMLQNAFASGNVCLVDWLWTRYVKGHPQFDAAGNVIVDHLSPKDEERVAAFHVIHPRLWSDAACKGHLGVLEWLSNKFPIGESEHISPLSGDKGALALEEWCQLACTFRHVQVFEWCIAEYDRRYPGRPFTKNCPRMDNMSRSGL